MEKIILVDRSFAPLYILRSRRYASRNKHEKYRTRGRESCRIRYTSAQHTGTIIALQEMYYICDYVYQ